MLNIGIVEVTGFWTCSVHHLFSNNHQLLSMASQATLFSHATPTAEASSFTLVITSTLSLVLAVLATLKSASVVSQLLLAVGVLQLNLVKGEVIPTLRMGESARNATRTLLTDRIVALANE